MSTVQTMRFVGTALETSFYGLYSVAFVMTWSARTRGKEKGSGTNIVIYPLSLLFILCTVFCVIDIVQTVFILRFETSQDPHNGHVAYNINIANTAMYCAITFIAQSVLIYRCWLVWGRQWLAVITMTLILAWLSFGTSLAMLGGLIVPSSRVPNATTSWFYPLATAVFSISLAVNAIVTILLAVKTSILLRDVQPIFTVQKRSLHSIYQIISVINESGMLMLVCQVIWFVLFRLRNSGFFLVRGSIVMIYGLTPTLIQQISHLTDEISQDSARTRLRADHGAPTVHFAI